MDKSIFRSFRFKIILYCLISMIFALLTEGSIFGIGYLIYQGLYSKNIVYTEQKEDLMPYMSKNNYGNYTNGFMNSMDGLPISSQEFSQPMLVFIVIMAIFTAVVLFVLYFLILTKKISTYITQIGYGINELSKGNFDTRIEIKDQDELTDIAKNLNIMASNIKNIIESERNVENTKNELITNVAHDLRTPLTSIIGYLDLVLNKSLDEESKLKYIDIAFNKSKRLEKLIGDLFSYTNLEFGEVRMQSVEVDIVKMLEQLIDEFYPSFMENELQCEYTTSDNSILIYADGDLLARAFANLIGNAIKYGSSGKNIIIRIQKNENDVSVSITNFGILIPKKELTNIFNKFYRVENSRNEGFGGTGLGLAIAKSIIGLHKGSITAKSDFNGTVFEVKLPLRETVQG
ncbi:sensor histidine kinase [Clostridium sp. Marseille-P299]|uniref:sensor histidine kinase n=1 Tax=Clostridium sp. Marseille-P299 TaxID=1805477 RepID=UPI00082B25C3|nr:HAMP domain-containing sensor histidine kinase [Clostridium sp. Marseille-P299]